MYHFNLNGKCSGSVSDVLVNKTVKECLYWISLLPPTSFIVPQLSYLLALKQLLLGILIELRLTGDKKVTTRYLGPILAYFIFFTDSSTRCFIY